MQQAVIVTMQNIVWIEEPLGKNDGGWAIIGEITHGRLAQ